MSTTGDFDLLKAYMKQRYILSEDGNYMHQKDGRDGRFIYLSPAEREMLSFLDQKPREILKCAGCGTTEYEQEEKGYGRLQPFKFQFDPGEEMWADLDILVCNRCYMEFLDMAPDWLMNLLAEDNVAHYDYEPEYQYGWIREGDDAVTSVNNEYFFNRKCVEDNMPQGAKLMCRVVGYWKEYKPWPKREINEDDKWVRVEPV